MSESKEYPVINTAKDGLEVIVSRNGTKIPGIFLTYLQAERAIAKYKGKQADVTAKKRVKKGSK